MPSQFDSADVTDSSTDATRTTDTPPLFGSRDAWLWSLVVVALVLDIGLTYYGLSLGLVERNPIAQAMFSALGVIEGMLLLKGIVLAIALVVWLSLPRRYRPVVPIGVALPWFVATAINASLVLRF